MALTAVSQTFRAPLGYPSKIPGYPPKKSVFPRFSRDIPNLLVPTPSCGKPPPHRMISRPTSWGLCSFWGFPNGCFCEGVGNLNDWGRARTGCNNKFCVFCAGLLIESYTNSEMFTTGARTTQLLRFSVNPAKFAQPRLGKSSGRGYKFGYVCSYIAGITQA